MLVGMMDFQSGRTVSAACSAFCDEDCRKTLNQEQNVLRKCGACFTAALGQHISFLQMGAVGVAH